MALLHTFERPEISGPSVLVTGFSKFPGAPENPTEWLMHRLAEKSDFQHHLSIAVLPVSYRRAGDELDKMIRELRPDIAVHFGLAAEANGFRLEEQARGGLRFDLADVDGKVARLPGDVKAEKSTLPLAKIEQALKSVDLPVERSNDAGGYLCDFLFHRSCVSPVTSMAGFVHVPWLEHQRDRFAPGAAALTGQQLIEGAMMTIGACAEHWYTTEERPRTKS